MGIRDRVKERQCEPLQGKPGNAGKGKAAGSEQPLPAQRRKEGPDLPEQKQEQLLPSAERQHKAPHQNEKKKQKKKKRKNQKSQEKEAEEEEETAGDRRDNSTLAGPGCGTSRQAAQRRKLKLAKVAAGGPGHPPPCPFSVHQ